MAGSKDLQPDKFDEQPATDGDLARLQEFLLEDAPIRPGLKPQELSVDELEALLAQKRLEEARQNHRKLRTRQNPAEPVRLAAPKLPRSQPLILPPAPPSSREVPPVPDKLSTARFEPASLVAQRPVKKKRAGGPVREWKWVNYIGYSLEALVIMAAFLLLGNWALQQTGISLNLFGPASLSDFPVAASQPGGIVIKAQAAGVIELPATALPPSLPPTTVAAPQSALPLTPEITPVAKPTVTPVIGPVGPVAIASTPTPAIIKPVLQSVAEGAAPPPKPPRRLIIPKIGVDTVVQEVTVNLGNWQVADNVAGHHLGTALPGLAGNMVLAGHRDIRGSIFLRLNELQKGDEFKVVSDNGVFQYQITDISEVAPTELSVMAPTVDPTATLITCTPIGLATKRLIVKARLEK